MDGNMQADIAQNRLRNMISDAVNALPNEQRAVVLKHGVDVNFNTDPLQVFSAGELLATIDRKLVTDPTQPGFEFTRVDHTPAPDHVPDDWTETD